MSRQSDGSWQRRRGRAGVRLSGVAEPGSRGFTRSLARRLWKPRFSRRRLNTPQAQKNSCGCRHRCRRAIPDEDRGGGDRGLLLDLAQRLRERPPQRTGRPPLPDAELMAQIKAVIAELPTYGYRRVHAIGKSPPQHERLLEQRLALARECSGRRVCKGTRITE
jgi:hypothetical protein